MKTSFLTAGGITLILAGLLSCLMIMLVTAVCRKKYFPKSLPNQAHGILLAGKFLGGLILITALFGPLRDYLLISALTNLESLGSLLSFVLICCCLLGITFSMSAALESFLSGQVFKGQSVIVELQENNVVVAIVRSILIFSIAFAFSFGLGLLIQSFIPVPAIPNIR